MDRFDFLLDDDLAKRFRKVAMAKGKYKKGSITYAIEEAILAWLKNNSHSKLTQNPQNISRRRTKR